MSKSIKITLIFKGKQGIFLYIFSYFSVKNRINRVIRDNHIVHNFYAIKNLDISTFIGYNV